MKPIFWFVILATIAGCDRSSSLPPPRFANTGIVERVDDRRQVAKPPSIRRSDRLYDSFMGSVHRPITLALEVPRDRRALGINALDEVPDSTWFTNRIGHQELTAEQVGNGGVTLDTPEDHLPWTILSSKEGGTSQGMIVRDGRGEKFLVKFDQLGLPEAETAAHMITARLLWASGYHTTEDFLAYIRREDLRIDADATIKTKTGSNRRFVDADLATILSKIELEQDGRIRVIASRILPGKSLGGHAAEGVRKDDPNDVIPHEHRRDLRGGRAIFTWLDHVDITEDNSLDVWVEDPLRPGHHYVEHYLLDYGKSLGVMAMANHIKRQSYSYVFDIAQISESLLTLGLTRQPWEFRGDPHLRGVGLYEVTTFNPRDWKPFTPEEVALRNADPSDWLWGAKILMRFTPQQIRAAVDAGRLTDKRSADYLVSTIIGRQRATARYAFLRSSALDGFAVNEAGGSAVMCFDDLLLTYGLAGDLTTSYRLTAFDEHGHILGMEQHFRPLPSGHTCTTPIATAREGDGYTIVKLAAYRNNRPRAIYVHLARDPSARMRVIGIWRE